MSSFFIASGITGLGTFCAGPFSEAGTYSPPGWAAVDGADVPEALGAAALLPDALPPGVEPPSVGVDGVDSPLELGDGPEAEAEAGGEPAAAGVDDAEVGVGDSDGDGSGPPQDARSSTRAALSDPVWAIRRRRGARGGSVMDMVPS